MKCIPAVLVFSCFMYICKCDCPRTNYAVNLHQGTNNRALLNHVFQWKTVFSPVVCGRDCSMDPRCVSFNYQTNNYTCELSSARRAQNPGDFVERLGSFYYEDNLDAGAFPETGYSSCLTLFQAGYRDSGIYTIFPTSLTDGLQVYCDMETDGGGWIVFQRRQNGSVDFYRNWTEYQSEFGDLQNEFWLGNDILRDLTGSGQWQLRVDVEDWETNTSWALYGEFAVTGDNYTLSVGLYDDQSTAGDSMEYHNGHPFSTKDQDNDAKSFNCAERSEGGWWFNGCLRAHLNGKYYPHGDVQHGLGIQWRKWTGDSYSLKNCSMKIRQVKV